MSLASEESRRPPGPVGWREIPVVWGQALTDLRVRWRDGLGPADDVPARRHGEAMVALALCVIVVLVAWLGDATIAHAARRLPPWTNQIFQHITALGKSGWIFALSGLVAFGGLALAGRGHSRRDTALRLLAARGGFVLAVNAVSGILSQVVKHLVGRARPKFLDMVGPFHFDLFAIKASFASFPSGHTVTSFATALAVGYFLPRLRWPLVFVAVLVAVSRVAIGAHYPSDVLAGAALGSATTFFLARACARRRIVFEPVGEASFRPRGFGLVSRIVLRREPARA